MKCLIINASPHKGNTWTLAEIVKKQMQSRGGVDFEEVHLYTLALPFCIGCYKCIFDGEQTCPHSSTVQEIAEKIENSDCVIITSSTYSLQLNALCKNFIDHMSYNFHRPRFFTKKALVISTTAGMGAAAVTKYIKDILMHWGFNKVYALAIASRSAKNYQPSEKVVLKCQKIADTLYNDVASGMYHSPSFKRVMMYNVWRGMSVSGADMKYWTQTGLKNTPYSPQVKTGYIKNIFGNIMYKLVKNG